MGVELKQAAQIELSWDQIGFSMGYKIISMDKFGIHKQQTSSVIQVALELVNQTLVFFVPRLQRETHESCKFCCMYTLRYFNNIG